MPGAGSSVAGGWLRGGHDAAINLYDQSVAARRMGTDVALARTVLATRGRKETVGVYGLRNAT